MEEGWLIINVPKEEFKALKSEVSSWVMFKDVQTLTVEVKPYQTMVFDLKNKPWGKFLENKFYIQLDGWNPMCFQPM